MSTPSKMASRLDRRDLWFFLLLLSTLVVYLAPLRAWYLLSVSNQWYSHVILIPPVSLALVYLDRRRVFLHREYCPKLGIFFLALSLAAGHFLQQRVTVSSDRFSLEILTIVLAWLSGFVWIYGTPAFRAAWFPLAFLLLMVPIPPFVMEGIVGFLVKGSAEATHGLFRAAGTPVFRDGLRFSLPGVELEVARECSGIHSSIALLVTGLIAGHLLLKSPSRKLILILSILPIMLFKNALRIAVFAWLGVYVSRDLMDGRLHHEYSGLIFSAVAVFLLSIVLLALYWSESRSRNPKGGRSGAGPRQDRRDGAFNPVA
jgi:exosortase